MLNVDDDLIGSAWSRRSGVWIESTSDRSIGRCSYDVSLCWRLAFHGSQW